MRSLSKLARCSCAMAALWGSPRTAWGAENAPAAQPLVFQPSRPTLGQWSLGVGMLYDAIDPQVVYGMTTRVPQFQFDLRVGLGKGWSWLAHCNTIVVLNELTTGPAFTVERGRFSVQLSAQLGAYLGFLEGFGFASFYTTALARPAVTFGYDLDPLFVSLRGDVILGSPEFASVGGTTSTLADKGAFAGYGFTLNFENRLGNGDSWFFGGALLTTRSSYQLWVLFPDSQGLFSYPRIFAGYEF
jgi:hypothetical protein